MAATPEDQAAQAVAATERKLQPLIEMAKSCNVATLRNLLVKELKFAEHFRAVTGMPTTELVTRLLTSEAHWQLYETLAKNPKLPAVRASLCKSRKMYADEHADDESNIQHPFCEDNFPTKQVRMAECNAIHLAWAARRWCYQTDDVDKFKFMCTEPLYKDEMKMSVTEMFFDMPRYGTGKVARLWWDMHQLADGAYPWGVIPPVPHGSYTMTCDPRHWCVLQMKGCIQDTLASDWDNYHHLLNLSRERIEVQLARDNQGCALPPIFSMPPYTETQLGQQPSHRSLYELAVEQILEGSHLHAPPFLAIERTEDGGFANGNSGQKWDQQPNRCGRKCLQWLLPSFGFWFALGLPKELLVREDRMVYYWWLVSRWVKRGLFAAKLAKRKACPNFNAVYLSPGQLGYTHEALTTSTAQSMRGRDRGTGRLVRQRRK